MRSKLMEGVLIRSRARWIGDGEKMSQYFLNLEKRHFASKTMTSLIKEDGTEIIDNDEMISEVRGFYNKLYENRDDELKDVDLDTRLSIDTPRLSDEEAQTLKGKITLEEASTVLKIMKNSKSPGSDGFTVEFFNFFRGTWAIF
ncbi:Pol-like protein [Elysia marginata]|uniref:Pol-like protein n=1 Tax=Elysia marginata TaxID=1093978 RepID=A0AAV4HJX8_9GAST|nr:Pol-like protein [Elysia marginata]